MVIPQNQVQSKKKIGTVDSDPVWEVALKGGLHLCIRAHKSGRSETLGAGSHRAVARHIAQKKEPKLVITELNKAEYVPLDVIAPLLPKYEALTDAFRRQQGF